MAAILHIRLLGKFGLVCGDRPVMTVNTPRLQALLAYLVLHPTRRHRRSVLAALIAPDVPESRARHFRRETLKVWKTFRVSARTLAHLPEVVIRFAEE